MFANATSFNQDISGWNITSAAGRKGFKGEIENFVSAEQ